MNQSPQNESPWKKQYPVNKGTEGKLQQEKILGISGKLLSQG
jgi:hypothetical protein